MTDEEIGFLDLTTEKSDNYSESANDDCSLVNQINASNHAGRDVYKVEA
jgi:hypothetical protein